MKAEIGIGAEFSPDKKYRFSLWRIWDLSKPLIMFIGLNPSTANERTDDPTIRRLAGKNGFANKNGYGGFYMMNLFPFVTAYPAELKAQMEFGGCLSQNNMWLEDVNLVCETIVFCWGNFDTFGRDKEVMAMFPAATCMGVNKNGSPKHPLYLKGNTRFINFDYVNK